MSLIRKIRFEKYPKVRDAFGGAWGIILAASNADRIEIVYDSYLKGSIKESTRIGRAKEKPIKIINLNLDSPVSPEIRKFCALSINKEHLQILSRNYFLKKGKEKGKHIIPSGYVTDKDGICKAQKLINDEIIERDDLNCIEEGAGSRIVLHTTCAAKRDFRQFLVLSTDTDVVMYNLAYSHVYKTMNVNKIGVKFGIHQYQRHIPVHDLAEILGTEKSRALLKAHILTGCDVTSKIRSKTAAFKACPEKYLYHFGE